MAIDADLLATARPGEVVWRTYGWSVPSWTFGYTQRWEEVQRVRPDDILACVRRPTGGGIVDHRRDFTYSLIIPADHDWWRTPVCRIYGLLHQIIAEGLREVGMNPIAQPCGQRKEAPMPPSQSQSGRETGVRACFARAEPDDLVDPATGTKWAGAALKRSRSGLLIQGSIQIDAAIAGDWREMLCKTLPRWVSSAIAPNVEVEESTPLPSADSLRRFTGKEWNQKR